MEKEFCTYNQALRLKALGFDEPCFGFYDDVDKGFNQIHSMASVNGEQYSKLKITKAPTWQSAFRWFREKHNLHCAVNTHTSSTNQLTYICSLEFGKKLTYEEAELACLDKLLEIVESKQKEDG